MFVVDQIDRFTHTMAHFIIYRNVHYRSRPTFIVHSADFCCCWISVDCSFSRDVLHLQETHKNRSGGQTIHLYKYLRHIFQYIENLVILIHGCIIVNAVEIQEEDGTDSALCKPKTRKTVRSCKKSLQSFSVIEVC